tara:strand:- start:281 stop:1024 length:744 start_codon:yes stop_codon:yes gene_type:complete
MEYKIKWDVLNSYKSHTHILNCPFNKLFSNDVEISKVPNNALVYKSHCLSIDDSDNIPDNFNTFNSKCAVRFVTHDSRGRNIDFMYNEIPEKLIHIYTKAFHILEPIKELQDKIDEFSKNFDKNTISVHIRSWNRNGEGGRRNYLHNLSKFEIEMNKFDNKHTFYIATDSSDVQDYFRNVSVLKKRVFIYPRKTDLDTSRDFPEGVQEDLIELYLLAQNNRLIGSHFSTFTEVAWWLGVEKKEVLIL